MGLGARFNALALALVEALFASTSSSFVFSCVVSRSFDNRTWSIVAVKFCGVHPETDIFQILSASVSWPTFRRWGVSG